MSLLLVFFSGASSLAFAGQANNQAGSLSPLSDPNLQLIATPNDNAPKSHCYQAVIDAIRAAKASIQVTLFHLTDQSVIQELTTAAKRIHPVTQKPIRVQVILDPTSPNLSRTLATLNQSGIQAIASSACFNMTFARRHAILKSSRTVR